MRNRTITVLIPSDYAALVLRTRDIFRAKRAPSEADRRVLDARRTTSKAFSEFAAKWHRVWESMDAEGRLAVEAAHAEIEANFVSVTVDPELLR